MTVLKTIISIWIGIIIGFVLLELTLRGFGYVIANQIKFTHLENMKFDELRILTLGDSMTNSGTNTYPSQLQEILSNNPKIFKKIKVINGGVPGSASQDIVNRLEEYLNKYNPDIVVLMTGINSDQIVKYDQWANIKNDGLNNIKTYKLIKYFYQNIRLKYNQKLNHNKISYVYTNEINVDDIIEKLNNIYPFDTKLRLVSDSPIEKQLFDNLSKSTPNKDETYMELSYFYVGIGQKDLQIICALKALSINRNNASAYSRLSNDVAKILTFEEREKLLYKALEVNPNYIDPYIQLGHQYSQNNKEKELSMYKKGISNNPRSSELWFWLGKFYYLNGNLQESEIALKKVININDDDSTNRSSDAYQLLAKIYQQQNRSKELNNAIKMAIESSDVLENNLPIIAEILKKKGVKLIAMQYPLRDVNILKNILKDYDVTYVDNKKSFEDALETKGTEKIFIDLFAGDFGHCTPEGNRIMAENVAEVLLNNFNLE